MNTSKLIQEANKHILYTTERPDIIMAKGKGVYLWDTEGKKYLDFIGGWAVTSLGHCPDVMVKAIENQAKELINGSPAYYNIPMIQFASLLAEHSCFDRVFFSNSGSEANESAIKLARKYGEKYKKNAFEIITTIDSFHGRTLATMSASGKKYWEKLFEPKVRGFKHVALNDLEVLIATINLNTCAIMLEPIQGEGGVYEIDLAYIKKIKEICDKENILLIFDEVQTGIGRTGKLFAYEHYGIEPDIMTLGKGIGGGYPLSAMLTKEKFNIFEAGNQGGTYSAQPLGMRVGLEVVKEIIEKDIPKSVCIQGNYILEKLTNLRDRFSLNNIRGKGLLIAFDLPLEKGSHVVSECLGKGLLLNAPKPATIRLMPPLTVNKEEVDEMFAILEEVLEDILKN